MGRRGDETRRGIALPLAAFALVCLPATGWAWLFDDGNRPPPSTAPAAGQSSTPSAVDSPATASAAAIGPGAQGHPVAPAPAPGGAGVPSTAMPTSGPVSAPPQPPSPSVQASNTGN